MYTYLILNTLTISFPLLRSFENRINYFSNWLYILISVLSTGIFFILWDHIFTLSGVWEFNQNFILGLYLFQLPIEEWIFFITVPFACIFIYEVLKYFIKKNFIKNYEMHVSWLLIILFLALALLNTDKLYTFVNFSLCGIFLFLHLLIFGKQYLANFYITYIVHLIPFFIVNGVLTYLPVVIYNNAANLNIRVISIPIEDFGYSFLLLLSNISIYETTKKEFPGLKLKFKPKLSS